MKWTRYSRPPSPLMRALRTLSTTAQPVRVEVRSLRGDQVALFREDDLYEVKVTRGGDDDYDILPHVLTITAPGGQPILAGHEATLTVAGQTRFRGRMATDSQADAAGRLVTTMNASSWSVMLDQMNPDVTLQSTIAQALSTILAGSRFGIPFITTFTGALWTFNIEMEPGQKYQDVIGKLTSDSGVAVLIRKNGNAHAVSVVDRRASAAAAAGRVLTLPRRAVLSPAEHTQPVEVLGREQAIRYKNATNGNYTTSSWGWELTNHDLERETHDREWWVTQPGSDMLAYGELLAFRSSFPTRRLPKVTVELIPLLLSPSPARRALARYLISLEVGSPIPLGADWGSMRGIHFVTGMSETLSARKWTMELTLSPHTLTVGTHSPQVSGLTWDTSRYRWDEITIPWEDYT